jgi:hypothetical protein
MLDINSDCFLGATPLLLSVKANNFELFKYLCDHPKIDAYYITDEDQTIAHYIA